MTADPYHIAPNPDAVDDATNSVGGASLAPEPVAGLAPAAQTDGESLASAVADDVAAMVAAGRAQVHSDVEGFVRAVEEGEPERARRAADPRTRGEIRTKLGELLQRVYDADWHGTFIQRDQAIDEFQEAMRRDGYATHMPAEAIQPGTYIHAVGIDPHTREPEAADGIVEQATYISRPEPGWSHGAQPGVRFVIRPVWAASDRNSTAEVFVAEQKPVIELPLPVDRDRPAWLDQPRPPAARAFAPLNGSTPTVRDGATDTTPAAPDDHRHPRHR